MKLFVTILYFCLVTQGSSQVMNEEQVQKINDVLSVARFDSTILETYASYILSRYEIRNGSTNTSAILIYSEMNKVLMELISGDDAVQVKDLLKNIWDQMKIMFRILFLQGIQQETVAALWLPLAYNDMINILSVHANKLSGAKIQIIYFNRPRFPYIYAKNSNSTAKSEYYAAFLKARTDINALKLLVPKLVSEINTQQTIIYDTFNDFMTKLGSSVYNFTAVTKKSYADGIKALIEDSLWQAETIFKVFALNGIKEAPIVLELVIRILTDMMTELYYFMSAI